jgi:hypothetical protein
MAMARHIDDQKIREAKIVGAASGLKGVLYNDPDPERTARWRAEWPELFDRIDQVADLVDWHPPHAR